MDGSVYKIIEIVGTSKNSWEDATKFAIETASKSLEDLRVAEIVKMDVAIENGKVSAFRVRLNRILQVSRRVTEERSSAGVAGQRVPQTPAHLNRSGERSRNSASVRDLLVRGDQDYGVLPGVRSGEKHAVRC